MERKIKVALLSSSFIFVAVGFFSIPIIIYATSTQDTTGDSVVIETLVEQFDVNECSQQVWIAISIDSNGIIMHIAIAYNYIY